MIVNVTESEAFMALLIQLVLADPDRTKNWGITDGAMPHEVDNFLTVYGTTPIVHGRLQRTGRTSETYGVQLRVRSGPKDQRTGKIKAQQIARALADVSGAMVTVRSTYTVKIKTVHRSGGVNYIGEEEKNKRHLHTVNFLVDMTEVGQGVGE